MVFKTRPRNELYQIPSLKEDGIPHVYFGDVLGSIDPEVSNPIVGSWFRIESGPQAEPPKYEYDEVGIVIEGEITLHDKETGEKESLQAGESFIIYRGSSIAFSTARHGLAWKCGSRRMTRL